MTGDSLPEAPTGKAGALPARPAPPEPAALNDTRVPPTFHASAERRAQDEARRLLEQLGPGSELDDFHLLSLLGQGSFGRVFLAQQLSLDRHVALKITPDSGSEARTLASLEHDHIVRVFSDQVDGERRLRLLCMQYVPGTMLERVIAALAAVDRSQWSGRAIIEAVDRLNTQPSLFHPAALRDREELARADYIEAVCWIGARLAEAIDYAHARGVLHRDIKPANILVNAYGRPLLVDFNLAFRPERIASEPSLFGGTLAYMAPEHLDAFNAEHPTPLHAVDRRSDVYSLGIVLFELLTGELPFAEEPGSSERAESLEAMAADRRAGAPGARARWAAVPYALDQVLRRAIAPDPNARFQTAAEMARALAAAAEQHRRQCTLPVRGPFTRAGERRPFLTLLVLTMLPHLVGSVVNVTYNQVQIVDHLTAAQKSAFVWVCAAYNTVMYPLCLVLLVRLVTPVFGCWAAIRAGDAVDPATARAARRRISVWPLWAVALSCLGWLPGAVLFPAGIVLVAGPVAADVYGHFVISFTLSGLIALTYSFFAAQCVVLRLLYPRLWAAEENPAESAELATTPALVRAFQFLAGTIPLAGAAMLVAVGPETSGYRTFRLLVTALIALGMAGFGLAIIATGYLTRTLRALGGTSRTSAPNQE